jgi:SNF2 family DNA or RNA helicase
MTSFYTTIIFVELSENQIPTDFEIISIKWNNHDKKMIFKVTQNDKLHYISYFARSNYELYLFLEIKNNSPIWKISYDFGQYTVNNSKYRFPIYIKIDPDNNLIHEYLNTSITVNTFFSENYDKLPVFDQTDFSSKSFIPYDEPIEPPNNFKKELFEYQKRSLSKMIKIEKGETNFTVKYTVVINLCNQDYIYDPISNEIVLEHKYLNVDTKGGVLSDEMGLGKTRTSIALIATNPASKNHPAVKYSNNYQMNKLFTKATLVLCPSHLTKQWKNEINDCNPNFKILSIVTKKDMKNLSVSDIQTADIIITSHQFLMNFDYYPTLHYKKITACNYSSFDRRFHLKAKLNILMNNQEELLNLETPLFEFFFFQRIILDEGHEIFGEILGSGPLSRYMSDWISSMDSNYFWYVSGTPFINFVGVKNSANFINLKLVEKIKQLNFNYLNDFKNTLASNNDLFNFMSKKYFLDDILSKICIRHCQSDIKNEITIPGYEEKLIWVKFTELERQLYETKKNKVSNHYLQQLCCHPMVIESTKKIFGNVEVDLSLMQDKLIEYHNKNYETYKNKLNLLDKTKQEYFMLKKTYECSMNESHYLLNILTKMKEKPIDEDENCSICMDPLDNPTLTACGHIFCYDCLKLCLCDKKKCPMCKTDLSGKELLIVNKSVNKKLEEINPLISKYGSKLGKTISIIRTLVTQSNSHIIIFSQWDDMLYLIGKTLSENGIDNCFVKGNVWSRNSAINKFKASKTLDGHENKVIMLSLKNAASGTNLIEATHILFIEPINASKEECKAIESQAIGRACRVGQKNKVTVMRILIEDSIEEEIYKKNYNKDLVINFKNDDTLIKELLPIGNPKEMVI